MAARLGKALGVPPHAASMFTEAEVRAGIVFQLSKLNSFVLRAARTAAGAALWEGLVAGSAVGVSVCELSVPCSMTAVLGWTRIAKGVDGRTSTVDHRHDLLA